jgi:hypothetical protein
MSVELVSLSGRGWPVLGECVSLVRLRDGPGFAVGVQGDEHIRRYIELLQTKREADQAIVGQNGQQLERPAPRRAAYLAALHQLPIVESI